MCQSNADVNGLTLASLSLFHLGKEKSILAAVTSQMGDRRCGDRDSQGVLRNNVHRSPRSKRSARSGDLSIPTLNEQANRAL